MAETSDLPAGWNSEEFQEWKLIEHDEIAIGYASFTVFFLYLLLVNIVVPCSKSVQHDYKVDM